MYSGLRRLLELGLMMMRRLALLSQPSESGLSIANGSRSRREHIISVAPENPGNGVVLFVERIGHSLKYSISIQGELFFQCQTICDGICMLFLAQYATNIPY